MTRVIPCKTDYVRPTCAGVNSIRILCLVQLAIAAHTGNTTWAEAIAEAKQTFDQVAVLVEQ